MLDPISKNPVPPGATPEEVRDDVDIKVSEGEYVIPANVVRYLGLDKIEKLVNQAKEGLAKLQEDGRIGGKTEEPQAAPSDDLPFSPEDLAVIEEGGEGVPQMAEGGLVYTPPQSSEIDPKTGLPLWMLEDMRKKRRTSSSNPSESPPPPAPTGLQQAPDKWSAQDLVKYTEGKDSVGSKVGRGIVSTVVPFGGLVMKAQDAYLGKKIPEMASALLKSGVNPDGSPLSAADKAALSGLTQQKTEERRGLFSLLKGNSSSPSNSTPKDNKKPASSKNSDKSLVSPKETKKTIYDYV